MYSRPIQRRWIWRRSLLLLCYFSRRFRSNRFKWVRSASNTLSIDFLDLTNRNPWYYSLPIVVGFALNSNVYSWTGKTIYMRKLFVDESHRSKKSIAKFIFEGLLKHAKANGVNRIECHTSEVSTGMQAFCEKMGGINYSKEHGFVYYRLFVD